MGIISKDFLRSPFHIQTCLKHSNVNKEVRINIYDIAKVALGPRYCQIGDRPWWNKFFSGEY